MEIFLAELKAMAETSYGDFVAKLSPAKPRAAFLGVRIPRLRALAARLRRDEPAKVGLFLRDLPHVYREEQLLHVFFLHQIKDKQALFRALDAFLPYVDSWEVSDALAPPLLKEMAAGRSPDGAAGSAELLGRLLEGLQAEQLYRRRFCVVRLLSWYLDPPVFRPAILPAVAAAELPEYYMQMAVAWFFAEALAKQPAAAFPYFAEAKLSPATGRKAISKALESCKISPQLKEKLREIRARS